MKISFSLPTKDEYHQYCIQCHSENVHRVFEGDKTFYQCSDCGHRDPRMIVIDPDIVWWVDEEGNYWHESVGIFLRNTEDRILCFERLIYPFALTLPAGHLDTGEDPKTAIIREVKEETGIELLSEQVKEFSVEPIVGDSCRRGCDHHQWTVYTAKCDAQDIELPINDEGKNPQWVSLEEILDKNPVYPLQFLIEKYGNKLVGK